MMEAEGLIFSEDICRLCLWRSNRLSPIFSDEGELQGIPMKIGMCLPITVSRDDDLPKLICSRCIYKLEMFFEFRNSCVRFEQLLKRYTVHEVTGTTQTSPSQVQQQCQQQQVPHTQQFERVESCHSLSAQNLEGSKLEVVEAESEPNISAPFMCMIPDQPAATSPGPEHKHAPVIENVDSVTGGESVTTDDASDVKEVKTRRKVQKHTTPPPSPKKSGNPGTVAVQKTQQRNGTTKEKKASYPIATIKRNSHKCKHCSKCFPSRLRLNRHLTSSNCLFRYTCRYCGKNFSSAESRIQHERNHRDKKNFVCRTCKEKFQSSFDLHVHTVQGCRRSATNVQSTKKSNAKKTERKSNSSNETKKGLSRRLTFKCNFCSKIYSQRFPYQKHLQSCRQKCFMKQRVQKSNEMPDVSDQSSTVTKEQANSRRCNEGVRLRSRRKQIQEAQVIDNSLIKNTEKSPKESLLEVLGLKGIYLYGN